jgi:hypothetical protein
MRSQQRPATHLRHPEYRNLSACGHGDQIVGRENSQAITCIKCLNIIAKERPDHGTWTFHPAGERPSEPAISIMKQLDELGSILADMVATKGEASHIDAYRRLDAIEKIVQRIWPDKLREAKEVRNATRE